jgi:hydroxyacylglutathione hydrolase
MANLTFDLFICRTDNYGLLIHDPESGATAAVDAPDAAAIESQLMRHGWVLTHLFTTHRHGDHVEGNAALQQSFGCRIIGPTAEADSIPCIDVTVRGGDSFSFAGREVRVLDCPGHTRGHIAYHMPEEEAVFAGDTLFSLGCGRVFEGSMEEMYRSVSQFKTLPASTRLYCGHEYTQSNARFALSVEPGNAALQDRAAEVDRLRAKGALTCPSTIGEELRANPFLRTGSPEIRVVLGLEDAGDAAVFAELRRRKDGFK